MKSECYPLSEIPEIDSAEFDYYRSARRTGGYFWQRIIGEVLEIKMNPGWIPIGKTKDNRILRLCEVENEIAIMYEWKTKPEEKLWFHVELG